MLGSSLGRLLEEVAGGGELSLREEGPAWGPAGWSELGAGVLGVQTDSRGRLKV